MIHNPHRVNIFVFRDLKTEDTERGTLRKREREKERKREREREREKERKRERECVCMFVY